MIYRYPKLRPVEAQPFAHNGQTYILLRDPLRLTEKSLLVPQALRFLLPLCDGKHENAQTLSAALAVRYGLRIQPERVEDILATLDDALMLENDTFFQARDRVWNAYREAPFRPPALAGQSYPDEADALRDLLKAYQEVAQGPTSPSTPLNAKIQGLVSPHIDYQRGGPAYAQVWQYAADSIREADLVILLGTDHAGANGHLTLTRQHYATPFGVLPTARDIVDTLAKALDEETAFADELHHRTEHSIELAAVWLHYIRDGRPCEIVPVLCGSFSRYIHKGLDATQDTQINALVKTLKATTKGRRVLIVAAADLAHVGPAFGGHPLGPLEKAQLKAADANLMTYMCAGDAEGFLKTIKKVSDRNNVCGVPPIYLTLRLLPSTEGEQIVYTHCPADAESTSLVSICGIVFKDP